MDGEPRPHHSCYIAGGDLVLQVNNALFKLHRHFLVKHSIAIRDMMNLPGPQELERSAEESLVKLSGDTVKGWETMMQLFYPDNPCVPVSFTAEEWAAILLLAHKYLMDGIELSALRQLRKAKPPLDMVELMVVAQTVGSEELYQLALSSLAQRDQMLSLEEAQKIGLKAFHDVMTTEHVYFVRQRRPIETKFARRKDEFSDSD